MQKLTALDVHTAQIQLVDSSNKFVSLRMVVGSLNRDLINESIDFTSSFIFLDPSKNVYISLIQSNNVIYYKYDTIKYKALRIVGSELAEGKKV